MVRRSIINAIAIAAVMFFIIGASVHLGRQMLARRGPATAPIWLDTGVAEPRVASISPAGTDLVIGIGARRHLVAISNYDSDRPETAGLPRIGDYLGIDREKLVVARPQVLITQYGKDRINEGVKSFCDSSGIRIVNIHIEVLDDIFREMTNLGDVVGERPQADAAVGALRGHLDAIHQRVAALPPVPTLIVTNEGQPDLGIVGSGTFLDELLTTAGGTNVASGGGVTNYKMIDRETLTKLAPQVVLQLLPDATPQQLAQAQGFWATVPNLPAVKSGRVYPMTVSYALVPGPHVGDLAEKFASLLHPAVTRAAGP
jgi:iron complex transport system substrate-binding protein